jgi:hypothetical protein
MLKELLLGWDKGKSRYVKSLQEDAKGFQSIKVDCERMPKTKKEEEFSID